MVFIQWGRPSPLARNIVRKVLRVRYKNAIERFKALGHELPIPKSKKEERVTDGHYALKARQIMVEGLKLDEGKIEPAPYDGNGPNSASSPPPYNGHVFRSIK